MLVLVLETSPQKRSEGRWQSFHITGFLFHRLITRQLRWSVCLSDPKIKMNYRQNLKLKMNYHQILKSKWNRSWKLQAEKRVAYTIASRENQIAKARTTKSVFTWSGASSFLSISSNSWKEISQISKELGIRNVTFLAWIKYTKCLKEVFRWASSPSETISWKGNGAQTQSQFQRAVVHKLKTIL